jgi:sulfate permease, SulP family
MEGRLFFANAQGVAEKMRSLIEPARPSVVVLDCGAVIDIEYTAVKMLIEAERKLRDEGIALWLAALNPGVLAVVRRTTLAETLGRERMLVNLETAVERFELTAVHRPSPQKGAGS